VTALRRQMRPAVFQGDELARGFAADVVPEQVAVYNPAFDVTPAELVTAIVTEHGVRRPPYDLRGERPDG